MYTDSSHSIAKGLIDGYIDVGCFLANSAAAADVPDLIVDECVEPLVWVRSKISYLAQVHQFRWSTGPTTTKKRQRLQNCIQQLPLSRDSYDLVNRDWLSRLPQSIIPPPLVQAKEYYLPPLPSTKTLLCARGELDNVKAQKLRRRRLNPCLHRLRKTWR
jgi:hypothetical protein